jgi:hypothetical protein
MLEAVAKMSDQVWIAANRFAAYALLNLIDDPAILAFAFCLQRFRLLQGGG